MTSITITIITGLVSGNFKKETEKTTIKIGRSRNLTIKRILLRIRKCDIYTIYKRILEKSK